MAEKILVVTGPTATGKTALSVELAKKLGGEIVSADSMQIYRGMDIGTAKVTKAEMQNIPHPSRRPSRVQAAFALRCRYSLCCCQAHRRRAE